MAEPSPAPAGVEMIAAGTRVTIRMPLLRPEERAPGLPADTAALPYEATVRGLLLQDSRVGEQAAVRTAIGRTLTGTVEIIEPADTHTFGRPSPALVEMIASISALRREGRA